jgi:hypothetical protein
LRAQPSVTIATVVGAERVLGGEAEDVFMGLVEYDGQPHPSRKGR